MNTTILPEIEPGIKISTPMDRWIERLVFEEAVKRGRELERLLAEREEASREKLAWCMALISRFDLPLTKSDVHVIANGDALPRLVIEIRGHQFEFMRRDWRDSVGIVRTEDCFVHIEECPDCGALSYDTDSIAKPEQILPWIMGSAIHSDGGWPCCDGSDSFNPVAS